MAGVPERHNKVLFDFWHHRAGRPDRPQEHAQLLTELWYRRAGRPDRPQERATQARTFFTPKLSLQICSARTFFTPKLSLQISSARTFFTPKLSLQICSAARLRTIHSNFERGFGCKRRRGHFLPQSYPPKSAPRLGSALCIPTLNVSLVANTVQHQIGSAMQ